MLANPLKYQMVLINIAKIKSKMWYTITHDFCKCRFIGMNPSVFEDKLLKTMDLSLENVKLSRLLVN